MITYCYQCGLERKPEPAVGQDSDGEPACTLHRLKDYFLKKDVPPCSPPLMPEETKAAVAAKWKKKLDSFKPSNDPSEELIPDSVPRGTPEKKSMRICKCGCGQEVPEGNRFSYIKGHMPRRGKKEPKFKHVRYGVTLKNGRLENNPDGGPLPNCTTPLPVVDLTGIPVTLTHDRANVIWNRLTLPEKAKVLFP